MGPWHFYHGERDEVKPERMYLQQDLPLFRSHLSSHRRKAAHTHRTPYPGPHSSQDHVHRAAGRADVWSDEIGRHWSELRRGNFPLIEYREVVTNEDLYRSCREPRAANRKTDYEMLLPRYPELFGVGNAVDVGRHNRPLR